MDMGERSQSSVQFSVDRHQLGGLHVAPSDARPSARSWCRRKIHDAHRDTALLTQGLEDLDPLKNRALIDSASMRAAQAQFNVKASASFDVSAAGRLSAPRPWR
jgi:hypothetical protein